MQPTWVSFQGTPYDPLGPPGVVPEHDPGGSLEHFNPKMQLIYSFKYNLTHFRLDLGTHGWYTGLLVAPEFWPGNVLFQSLSFLVF